MKLLVGYVVGGVAERKQLMIQDNTKWDEGTGMKQKANRG